MDSRYGENDLFSRFSPTGEIEVFHDLPRLVHARAVRTSSILVLPDAVFEDYMVMNPEVKRFISHTARQRFSIIQACAVLGQAHHQQHGPPAHTCIWLVCGGGCKQGEASPRGKSSHRGHRSTKTCPSDWQEPAPFPLAFYLTLFFFLDL
jgi:hypothetical protein